MTSRDDMVLPAHLGEGKQRFARTVAGRASRLGFRERSSFGLLRKLALARAARGARGAGRRLAGPSGGGKLVKGGAAALLAALVAVVTVRLASGRPIKNLKALLNDKVLGDLDDKARATLKARAQVLTPPVLRGIKQEGGVGHILPIFNAFKQQALREEKGRSIALQVRELTEDSPIEQLTVRGRNALEDAFYAAGGQQALDDLMRAARGGF